MTRQDLVPEQSKLEGVVAICCAHGDTVQYPLARVQVEIGGQTTEVEAAVSGTLPMSMLLGTDILNLDDLLVPKSCELHSECTLTGDTRA